MDRTTYCLDDAIEGAINFRDLGGYPIGDRVVRRGLVYRSGMMHHLTDSGLRILAQTHGLRSVIDLRSDDELSSDGICEFAAHAITHHHAPVFATISVDATERQARMQAMRENRYDWTASYVQMLSEGAPAFRCFLEVLAAPGALPAVFHCTGGRDRTGVAAALLLSLLGMDDAAVAYDYALTGQHLLPHIDRFAVQSSRFELTRAQWASLLQTTDTPMLGLLAHLRAEYGSVDGYLLSIGVERDALDLLRHTLVEPIATVT